MEAKESLTIPFTYRIICPDGEKYYGVRYAKNCHPSDLWNTYFTSSKEIKTLLKIYNKSEFQIEIRKIFNYIDDAIKFESRVLRRIIGKPGWLNKHVNGNKFLNVGPPSAETRLKISNSLQGHRQSEETVKKRVSKNTGKKRTEESKRKLSESNKGKHVISDETRQKLREAWERRKKV